MLVFEDCMILADKGFDMTLAVKSLSDLELSLLKDPQRVSS
jgi:hypothetical protein